MKTFEITVNLIQALAWPIATLVIALIFQRPIKQLLVTHAGSLRRLRVGPVEAEWNDQLPTVQTDTLVALANESPTRQLLRNYYAKDAERNPKHAILQAYCNVEESLREMVGGPSGSITYSSHGGPTELVREVQALGIVDDATVRAVDGIAILRNMVAHESDEVVTVQQALDYLALVDAVIFTLDMWASRAKTK